MKLQNFLISVGLFALFTVIIFGAINTNNPKGIYSENYLNITHDSDTSKAIVNISSVGKTTESDFQNLKGDMKSLTSNRSTNEERTEGNLIAEGLNVLMSLPNSWKPVANVMRMSREQFQIPEEFTQWIIGSVLIIIILILLGAFLKNKLSS